MNCIHKFLCLSLHQYKWKTLQIIFGHLNGICVLYSLMVWQVLEVYCWFVVVITFLSIFCNLAMQYCCCNLIFVWANCCSVTSINPKHRGDITLIFWWYLQLLHPCPVARISNISKSFYKGKLNCLTVYRSSYVFLFTNTNEKLCKSFLDM